MSAELAQLESVFSSYTEQKMWDDTGFQFPIPSRLTSPFGAFRTFNGTLNTRHTGWDMQAALGTPILASASGMVVFAGQMQVRGNHVIIDHGYGVFTTYSHMIEIHVARGDHIEKGQVIGEVGATGRTSGPHFHWETAVNGNFVDGVQFLEMWMP
ncbi:MAG: M23 family metallopeptidase [Anaerolineae bacterium]